MDKVIRDGFVAVLISPGFGAGWYSWHMIPELIYDPTVVSMVENCIGYEAIEAYCAERWPDVYFGGAEDLVITWIAEGEKFVIEEYDGSESIKFKNDFEWVTA
jgi:hypothetical protein